MKNPGLLLLCVILSGTSYSQNDLKTESLSFIETENSTYSPLFYLHKLFFDSISKDQFLFEQRYADFQCQGYTITLNNPETDPKIEVTKWIYAQDFSLYNDTTIYLVIHESIAYDNGFHFEYFKLFDKKSNQLIRQLMVSYAIHTNRIVRLMDSDIQW
jgi:hypothetical protein